MSHKEYCDKCDEDQLQSLIEHAQSRIQQIQKSGWVYLWVVSKGWGNVAWFTEDDYTSAVKYLEQCVRKLAECDKPQSMEFEIKKERYRPEEVAELISVKG